MFATRCLALLSLVVLMSGVAQAGLVPDRVAKAVQDRVVAGQYQVVVIAIVDGDNSEVVAFGTLPDGKAPSGDTVFEIGSVTKTFTATLLAKAVVDGKVRLDEPLQQLLPGWKLPSRNGKVITLGDIASQRSGLPRLPSNFKPKDLNNPYVDYDVVALKAFLANYELPRDPGASYEYSNLGFGLLGTALAQKAGKPYPTLLQDDVLAPLGMAHSSAANQISPQLVPGRLASGEPAKNWDLDAIAGAGAVRASGNDMLRYLKANMHPDQSPLGKAMTLAQTPRAVAMEGSHIGLAWMITDKKGIVWHNGMTGGYASFAGFTADRKHGVVILTNSAQTVDDLGFAALDPDVTLAAAQKAIAMDEKALAEYGGVYKLSDSFSLRVLSAGNQLFIQGTGQGAIPVYASAKDEFFARMVAASVSFTRDGTGKITGLVLHQNGDHAAVRQPDEATVALDAAVLQDYVGKYQLAPDVLFDVVVKDGKLFVQLGNQPSFEVYASAKDKFFYKVVEARIDFERDASGKVVALVLHQGGKDMRAPRVAP